MAEEEAPEIAIRLPIRLDQVPPTGLARRIEANERQREDIVRLLDLVSLDLLALDARVAPGERGRVSVTGRFVARGEQSCVVTLENVPFAFDEPIEVNSGRQGRSSSWKPSRIRSPDRRFSTGLNRSRTARSTLVLFSMRRSRPASIHFPASPAP